MVGNVGGEGVERGSWSTAGEGVPGIADPAARGQSEHKKTRHDLSGSIKACGGGAEATKAGCTRLRISEIFDDEASQGRLDVELEWLVTRPEETGSNGHVLLLPPKACLRDQYGLGESGCPPELMRRGEVSTM